MRRGPRASRKAHRNPGPVSQTCIPTAKHSATNHTRDLAHCLLPPLSKGASSALCHLFRMLCFFLERPLHPVFRMSNPLSPRSRLPPWTPAQCLRTGARSDVRAERQKSPISLRPTSNVPAFMQVQLIESYLKRLGAIPQAFHSFRTIRNTTPVTRPHPKVVAERLRQKLYRTPASIRRPLSAAYGYPKIRRPQHPSHLRHVRVVQHVRRTHIHRQRLRMIRLRILRQREYSSPHSRPGKSPTATHPCCAETRPSLPSPPTLPTASRTSTAKRSGSAAQLGVPGSAYCRPIIEVAIAVVVVPRRDVVVAISTAH